MSLRHPVRIRVFKNQMRDDYTCDMTQSYICIYAYTHYSSIVYLFIYICINGYMNIYVYIHTLNSVFIYVYMYKCIYE